MRWEGLSSLVKPSVIKNAKRASAKGVTGNLKGEGRLLGGLLVVGEGEQGIAFEHREAVSRTMASFSLSIKFTHYCPNFNYCACRFWFIEDVHRKLTARWTPFRS